MLFKLLSDPAVPIRLATSGALLRIVQKGLKEPSDKLQLFRVLSLGQVLEMLEEKTRITGAKDDEDNDDEVSYRESLGKLTSGLGLELIKLCDDVGTSLDMRLTSFKWVTLFGSKRGRLLPFSLAPRSFCSSCCRSCFGSSQMITMTFRPRCSLCSAKSLLWYVFIWHHLLYCVVTRFPNCSTSVPKRTLPKPTSPPPNATF